MSERGIVYLDHAGTTPMADRRDALVSASRLVLAVNRLAADLETCRVATVGSIQAHPNAVNVVPGSVSIGLEFRDLSMDALDAAEAKAMVENGVLTLTLPKAAEAKPRRISIRGEVIRRGGP